ncbi:unnamed protein product [Cyclocybe aegerita]|uniref:Uncharacterized protein n=1 Tax=Cyclocybe aegerita TaxID=1973307 RepID=A0A8S0VQR1_CYCAE|nr:unnamed protein product [Cyclocybe aegerita]
MCDLLHSPFPTWLFITGVKKLPKTLLEGAQTEVEKNHRTVAAILAQTEGNLENLTLYYLPHSPATVVSAPFPIACHTTQNLKRLELWCYNIHHQICPSCHGALEQFSTFFGAIVVPNSLRTLELKIYFSGTPSFDNPQALQFLDLFKSESRDDPWSRLNNLFPLRLQTLDQVSIELGFHHPDKEPKPHDGKEFLSQVESLTRLSPPCLSSSSSGVRFHLSVVTGKF